jgi:hypothetical protein
MGRDWAFWRFEFGSILFRGDVIPPFFVSLDPYTSLLHTYLTHIRAVFLSFLSSVWYALGRLCVIRLIGNPMALDRKTINGSVMFKLTGRQTVWVTSTINVIDI